MKEGALFNPSEELNGPGPGSYNADRAYALGSCKISILARGVGRGEDFRDCLEGLLHVGRVDRHDRRWPKSTSEAGVWRLQQQALIYVLRVTRMC